MGGLTVLKAMAEQLPAHYLYFGDTARLPYGTKSPETVARYAIGATKFLEAQNIDLLVIACNTATALALPAIKQPHTCRWLEWWNRGLPWPPGSAGIAPPS